MSARVTNQLLEAALTYARLGWPVFPVHTPGHDGVCDCRKGAECKCPGKHPRIEGWPQVATTDEGQIRVWWVKWPDANVAVLMGERSGLVALDVDRRHGGLEALAALEAKHGVLPETLVAHTGDRGRHYLFKRSPEGLRSTTIREGIEVKSDGTFIVVAPSRHFTGNEYLWEDEADVREVEIPPVPGWVQELVGVAPSTNGHGVPVAETIVHEGARNRTAARIAGAMRRHGASAEAILAALTVDNAQRFDPPLDPHEIATVAKSISRCAPSDVPRRVNYEPGGPVPEIRVNGRQDSDILHEGRTVLASLRDPEIYRHPSGPLLRIDDNALRSVTRGELHDLLARHAQWVRVKETGQGREVTDAAVPRRLLEPLLEAPCSELRVVRSFVPIPAFVGHDLRLVNEPGYDAETQTLFHGVGLDLPALPDVPSPDNMVDAQEVFDTWLREFPFADITARAHCMALLLTLLIRHSIAGRIPMFLVEAATAGTGKTTLAEVLCIAAHGVAPTSTAYTRDGEEMGKRAASWVLSGRPVAFLDDLSRITGDPAHILSSLITTGALEVRAMRELRTAGGRWDGVLVATGNNVGLAEEMPRKICRVRLESPENPATRRFKRQDLHAWTQENRARIVWAAGILLRAWKAVECPLGETVRPGFGRFSQVMGGILGCLDSKLARAFLSEDELADMMSFGEGMDELRAFVESWIRTKGQGRAGLSAKDLVDIAERAGVLEVVMGDGNDRSRSSRLGHYLKRQRGKVVAGHRIVGKSDPSAGATRWRLEPVEEDHR